VRIPRCESHGENPTVRRHRLRPLPAPFCPRSTSFPPVFIPSCGFLDCSPHLVDGEIGGEQSRYSRPSGSHTWAPMALGEHHWGGGGNCTEPQGQAPKKRAEGVVAALNPRHRQQNTTGRGWQLHGTRGTGTKTQSSRGVAARNPRPRHQNTEQRGEAGRRKQTREREVIWVR